MNSRRGLKVALVRAPNSGETDQMTLVELPFSGRYDSADPSSFIQARIRSDAVIELANQVTAMIVIAMLLVRAS